MSGELDAMVTATGVNSFFGKTMALLAVPPERGHLQQVRPHSVALELQRNDKLEGELVQVSMPCPFDFKRKA